MYKCPTCERHTLTDHYDKDTFEPYYMCNNKECPDYGKQMTNIEIVQ
ncbi:hypothetical protein [Bacillus cereus]|nr:hypothetical protein [Bacillus cereus]